MLFCNTVVAVFLLTGRSVKGSLWSWSSSWMCAWRSLSWASSDLSMSTSAGLSWYGSTPGRSYSNYDINCHPSHDMGVHQAEATQTMISTATPLMIWEYTRQKLLKLWHQLPPLSWYGSTPGRSYSNYGINSHPSHDMGVHQAEATQTMTSTPTPLMIWEYPRQKLLKLWHQQPPLSWYGSTPGRSYSNYDINSHPSHDMGVHQAEATQTMTSTATPLMIREYTRQKLLKLWYQLPPLSWYGSTPGRSYSNYDINCHPSHNMGVHQAEATQTMTLGQKTKILCCPHPTKIWNWVGRSIFFFFFFRTVRVEFSNIFFKVSKWGKLGRNAVKTHIQVLF